MYYFCTIMVFLTEEEFKLLPDKGTIDPKKIRFTQRAVSCIFRNGKCIICAAIELKTQRESNFPPINIVLFEGNNEVNRGIYTLDNRRLWVHQKAGVHIPYKKLFRQLEDHDINKFKTHNNGVRVSDIDFAILKDRL